MAEEIKRGKRLAKKVLLIGWDAADWKVINPLMDSGQMPTLEKLVNEGVIGNLATMDPPLSPMLWSSIGTGKRPYKHGILGFTEPDPSGTGIRPVRSTSRKVKAVWNIFTQCNIKSHVVGWWPSHPAEPINGICISNFYQRAGKPLGEEWPMLPGTVFPEYLSALFKEMRIHPGELTEAHILPFVPKAASIDQDTDKRLASLAKIIADCSTIHAAATYILEHEDWEFCAVYLDAIDHFCHGFMKFHPPKMAHIDNTLFDLYKDVVAGAYRYHDMMLERLLQLAGEDATVMLISDHGFQPDHLRPSALPKEPAAPALEHSPFGIICMKGDHIRKDERIYGASILDITPTLLTLFGLPVARDMDGKVLVNAFDEPVKPETILSWEDIEGESGMHPKDQQEDPYLAKEALDQLIALGYIEAPAGDAEQAIKQTISENRFYLARSYLDARKYRDAIPILEELYQENPQPRYGLKLAQCYQHERRFHDCRDIVEKIKEGQDDESPRLYLLEGSLFLNENKPKEALRYFRKAEEMAPELPRLNAQIGRGYMAVRQWIDAERAFNRELEIDYDDAGTHHGLGVALMRQGRYEEAASALLNAVGLIYHFPFAHYHLGEAMYHLGAYARSAEAFEVCLKMAPNVNKARQWLTKIYEEHLNEPEMAMQHSAAISEHAVGQITIVSGLPRSGTSMMMQMLDQGGMDTFTDNERQPDESNPRGYYEHEAVKSLARDKSFLKDAEGKAVKVIAQLLFHLPARFKYKIIFMERDIQEVLRSQHKMLVASGKVKEDVMPMRLQTAFEKNLARITEWLPQQQNIDIIRINHRDVINDPMAQAMKINQFLGGKLDVEAMANVVDKRLHRQIV